MHIHVLLKRKKRFYNNKIRVLSTTNNNINLMPLYNINKNLNNLKMCLFHLQPRLEDLPVSHNLKALTEVNVKSSLS